MKLSAALQSVQRLYIDTAPLIYYILGSEQYVRDSHDAHSGN